MMHRLRRIIFFLAVGFLACYGLLWVLGIPQSPVVFGASFSQLYAASLGLDWREAYRAMLTDLDPPIIRIAAPWSEGEAVKGVYAFGDLDWMMNEAAQEGSAVLLVVGQKVPRWPECYFPSWADTEADGARDAFCHMCQPSSTDIAIIRRLQGGRWKTSRLSILPSVSARSFKNRG